MRLSGILDEILESCLNGAPGSHQLLSTPFVREAVLGSLDEGRKISGKIESSIQRYPDLHPTFYDLSGISQRLRKVNVCWESLER